MNLKDITDQKKYQIYLYDDNEHNFLEIISLLVTVCEHSMTQADQCALIAHNVGKCSIKVGTFEEMFELKGELDDVGLTVEIEEYESSLHK